MKDKHDHQADIKLFERVKVGDEEARWELILAHQGLIRFAGKRIGLYANERGRNIAEDVEARAQEALIEAVDNFDTTRDVKFSTYALSGIEHAMRQEMQRTNALAEVPHHVRRLLQRVEKARRELAQESGGREPSVNDIAARLGLSEADRRNYEQARRLRENITRLGALEDEDQSFEPADPTANAAFDALDEDEHSRYAQLQALLDQVDPAIAKVVAARFGIGVAEAMSIGEAMQELGVNKVEMRQIEAETLQQLHRAAMQGDAG